MSRYQQHLDRTRVIRIIGFERDQLGNLTIADVMEVWRDRRRTKCYSPRRAKKAMRYYGSIARFERRNVRV